MFAPTVSICQGWYSLKIYEASMQYVIWKQLAIWHSHIDRHIPFLQSNLVFQQILQFHSYCAKKMRYFASCELCRQEFGISLSMFAICPCIRYVCYFLTHITRRLILLGNKSLSVRYITYKKMHKIALPKIPLHAKVIYSKYWRNLYLFVSILLFILFLKYFNRQNKCKIRFHKKVN